VTTFHQVYSGVSGIKMWTLFLLQPAKEEWKQKCEKSRETCEQFCGTAR